MEFLDAMATLTQEISFDFLGKAREPLTAELETG
jgi:hypothetical protein